MKKVLKISGIVITLLLLAFFVLGEVVERTLNRVKSSANPPVIFAEVETLHQRLWVADLHTDALLWRRNLLQRAAYGHVDIPRLIEGNIALQAFTIVSKSPFGLNFEHNDDKSDMITFLAMARLWPLRTWSSLKERALYQAGKLHYFAETSAGKLTLIKSKSDLRAYIERRKTEPKITAGLLGIEGAQVLQGKLENVDVLFAAGFRMMAPSHFFDTEVGGSAHGVEKYGLTVLGRTVIQRMEALGMIVDLAHASPKTIDDVLTIATKPVLVSHAGVKGTCDNTRNLSDAHLKGIAETGGVIGIAFFPMTTCGHDVRDIVRAIRYAVDLVGVEHVGLGSDFDGSVETPFDAAGMIQLTSALHTGGFSDEEIALIMGENVRRVLLETLPD